MPAQNVAGKKVFKANQVASELIRSIKYVPLIIEQLTLNRIQCLMCRPCHVDYSDKDLQLRNRTVSCLLASPSFRLRRSEANQSLGRRPGNLTTESHSAGTCNIVPCAGPRWGSRNAHSQRF